MNHGHPSPLSLQIGSFLGDRDGEPWWRSRTPLVGTLFAASLAVVLGEGHAPVVAVLLAAEHVNRFYAVAKLLSGRAGRPPSFSKLALPVQDRLSICFERLGA